jgi:bifunctional ADP-heptose synthase (sugar kinase/adenylyltransferase)
VDSRLKIVLPEGLPSGARLVSGYFDPLLAVHAAWLAEARGSARKLAVIVKDPPVPILPARARAELVAALKVVDFVVLDSPALPAADVQLEQRDATAAAAFVAHVHQRQG